MKKPARPFSLSGDTGKIDVAEFDARFRENPGYAGADAEEIAKEKGRAVASRMGKTKACNAEERKTELDALSGHR